LILGVDESTNNDGNKFSCERLFFVLNDVFVAMFRTSLEEYLQELTVTLDDGNEDGQQQTENATPNFAHAALILQNSTNVYGRKVEYLHSLVYKALYEFFKSTNGKDSSSSRRKSTDSAIEEFYDFDPHNDFMLLDDVVPEDFTAKKINLKEDDDEEEKFMCGSSTPNQSMMSLNRTRLSLGGLSVTRAERTSLGGGGFNPSSSSQQRALLGTLNDGALRLVNGKCDVGADGLLLLPGSSLSVPTNTLLDPSEGRRSLFGDEITPMCVDDGRADQDGFVTHNDNDHNDGDGDDDHANDGPGFEMNDDYDEAPMEASHPDNGSVVEATVGQRQEPGKRVAFEANTKKKEADPWAMLDSHSSDKQINKPLRKGKTYKLPPGVDLPPSECVTGASTRRMPTRRPLAPPPEAEPCLAVQSFRAFLQNSGDPPKIPFNGLAFGDEFAYIAKETAKKRAAERRSERKAQQESEQPNDAYEEDVFDDDNDYGGGFDFGGDDHDDDDLGDDNNGMGNVGMSSLDTAFENTTEGTNLGKTFEELCRAHIQAFAKGADDFVLNTQLSERVNKWQAKLSPILEEEERRATFDIHKYSERILETAEEGLQKAKRLSGGSITVSLTCIFGSFEVSILTNPVHSRKPQRLDSKMLRLVAHRVTSVGSSWRHSVLPMRGTSKLKKTHRLIDSKCCHPMWNDRWRPIWHRV
jgi:condensin-2 complex subunit H2